MSLIFSAVTPHPPFLIPAIGKDNMAKLERTKQALEKLEEELYLTHPDIIVVISPHSHHFPDAFSVNMSPLFECDLKSFGDLTTKLPLKGEMLLPYDIRTSAYEKPECPTVLINEPNLDHGLVVPLLYLTRHLPEVKVLPIGLSELDAKAHWEFGQIIREQIIRSNKRIAVIASGDLSHALTTDSPAGYNKSGPEFDRKLQELFSSHNLAGLLTLDQNLIKESFECGFRSFLILAGVLKDTDYSYESFAYEAPFGVGYLTANFAL